MGRRAQRDGDGLTIDRPERFLRRERAAQRAGLGVLMLFAAAGLAGLFGNGPLANATVTSGSATLRYERFTRQSVRTELAISVRDVPAATARIEVPRAFFDRLNMLDVRPPETLKQLDERAAVFEVPVTNGTASLVLHYEPSNYGVLDAAIVAAGQPPARVRQIVFF